MLHVFKMCVFINYRKATGTSVVCFFILNTGEIAAKTLSLEIYNTANVIHL